MSHYNGFSDRLVLAAMCELQEPFGKRTSVWLESSVILMQMREKVSKPESVGIMRTLRRMNREKMVERKIFLGVVYYSLSRSARDKYLAE